MLLCTEICSWLFLIKKTTFEMFSVYGMNLMKIKIIKHKEYAEVVLPSFSYSILLAKQV